MSAVGDNRLPELAAKISNAHTGARAAATLSLEHAIAAGAYLIEAKRLLAHGQWAKWLAENVAFSERTASMYMRFARNRDVIDTKIGNVADLSIRAAIGELTEPRRPDKLSDMAKAVRPIPLAGHIKLGARENAAGWDEVFIAPSYQHAGFFYATHLWTPRNGAASMVGTRRPIRMDMVAPLIEAHFSFDLKGVAWRDEPFPSWTYNILLFASSANYVDSAELPELVEIAQGKAPSAIGELGVVRFAAAPAPGPLSEMIFGDETKRLPGGSA